MYVIGLVMVLASIEGIFHVPFSKWRLRILFPLALATLLFLGDYFFLGADPIAALIIPFVGVLILLRKWTDI